MPTVLVPFVRSSVHRPARPHGLNRPLDTQFGRSYCFVKPFWPSCDQSPRLPCRCFSRNKDERIEPCRDRHTERKSLPPVSRSSINAALPALAFATSSGQPECH